MVFVALVFIVPLIVLLVKLIARQGVNKEFVKTVLVISLLGSLFVTILTMAFNDILNSPDNYGSQKVVEEYEVYTAVNGNDSVYYVETDKGDIAIINDNGIAKKVDVFAVVTDESITNPVVKLIRYEGYSSPWLAFTRLPLPASKYVLYLPAA